MSKSTGAKVGRRVAAVAVLVSLSGLGAATLTTSGSTAAVRAPGQITTATANACGSCYNHNEEAGRDDA